MKEPNLYEQGLEPVSLDGCFEVVLGTECMGIFANARLAEMSPLRSNTALPSIIRPYLNWIPSCDGFALFEACDSENPHFIGFFLAKKSAEKTRKALKTNTETDIVLATLSQQRRTIFAVNDFEIKTYKQLRERIVSAGIEL